MTPARDEHAIDTLPRLEALLGPLSDASIHKELPYVHPAYRAMIAASPFAVLATTGPGGLDASPRGDPAGFVQLLDDKTLLLPERRGNNRADSLRNIVADPRVALLFLIPGVGETLRVNGHARISVAPRPAGAFRGQRPAAKVCGRGGCAGGVLPVRPRHPALAPVGRRAARHPTPRAHPRRHPGVHHPR